MSDFQLDKILEEISKKQSAKIDINFKVTTEQAKELITLYEKLLQL